LPTIIEITLEANPTSVEAGPVQGISGCRVNRVSVGIQALNDTDLKRLGRLHTVPRRARRSTSPATRFLAPVST
jgi:coproporphyrinogen III oxidase-like Fe-S oxidoreductase